MSNYMSVQIFKPEKFQKGRKLIKKHFFRRPDFFVVETVEKPNPYGSLPLI